MNHQPNHAYEFGSFRLDAGERLLLRDGQIVPLTPKSFDLLLALVERHGRLVDKEELFQAVWPDTIVEESNLTYNISHIRKALGDGENGQKFIETVPKRGYRFVAAVREMGAEQAEISEAARSNKEEAWPEPLTSKVKRHRKGALLALAVSVIAFGGIAFGLYKFITRPESKSAGPEPPGQRVVPVTSLLGSEIQPAFSPDGNQIAFVWDGEQENNQDIYVKLVDTGAPHRLTTNPAPDLNPVWSHDSRYIAFTREGDESGIYLVPALGGVERKLVEVFSERPSWTKLSLSYSPDGKILAIADKSSGTEPYSIFLLTIETGEKRRLTFPPAGSVGDDSPAFSPDGQSLAFTRMLAQGARDNYAVPIAGGEPKRLTFDATWMLGQGWTSDGGEIIFSSFRGGIPPSLWRVPVAGGAPERVAAYAQYLTHPAISRQGNRLAWTQSLEDSNIWRIEITGAAKQATAPVKLIATSMREYAPQYSPDGQKIVFGSNRSGSQEIWVCDRNGENQIPVTNIGALNTSTPRWSPDGRQIAFDSLQEGNRDIYVISANGGRPHRFTREPSEDARPSWSRDGRWIYFGSNRSGSVQIWKMPVEGGPAVQVTRQGGLEGFESPDGRSFYYAKGRLVPGIWRIPVAGGEEALVLDHHRAGYWLYWAVTEQGIYFATEETRRRPVIEFYSFATGKVTLVMQLEKPLGGVRGLTVSPDGRWILYTQFDQSGSDIMLMENFR
jgi:Tol biopolymer transport system component/DNA-binding winged helix-turn-helix (wHTH) protein